MQRLKIYIIWANRWTSKEWWKILGSSSLRSCAKGETADYRPCPGVWKPCVQRYNNLLVTGYEVLMDVTMYIYMHVCLCIYIFILENFLHLHRLATWKRHGRLPWVLFYFSFWDMSIFVFRSWTGVRMMRANKGGKEGHKWRGMEGNRRTRRRNIVSKSELLYDSILHLESERQDYTLWEWGITGGALWRVRMSGSRAYVIPDDEGEMRRE